MLLLVMTGVPFEVTNFFTLFCLILGGESWPKQKKLEGLSAALPSLLTPYLIRKKMKGCTIAGET